MNKTQTKTLQNRLRRLGFQLGAIDGIAGPKTRGAVTRFQRAFALGDALAVDGIAGPKTNAALVRSHQAGGQVAPHFNFAEIVCRCGGRYSGCLGVVAKRADLLALEELRRTIRRPLPILSAYRCTRHNRAVGGASKSQHLNGAAYDLRVGLVPTSTDIPARFKGRGIRGPWYAHLDSRRSVAVWNY